MTYVAFHAKGTKAQCRKGRVRHSLTIDEELFQRIREHAAANKQSISAEMADRLAVSFPVETGRQGQVFPK